MSSNGEHILNVLLARIRTNSSVTATSIRMNDLTPEDVIILLMGPPKSGKTTFLEITAGTELAGRRNSEHPATSISAFKLVAPSFPGSIVLVNTPAFNNTDNLDMATLGIISDWVNQTYKRGILVSGLIYFHRISDPTMEGTPLSLRNWRVFEKICGNHFNKVVIATTMWGDVDAGEGERRSQDLQNFCRVRARGWSIQPFRRDHSTAADVLKAIVEDTMRQPLQLQREISDFRLSLKQTTAARALFLQLVVLGRRTEREMERFLVAMNMTDVGLQELADLEARYHKSAALLDQLVSRKDDLKETRGEKFQRFILRSLRLGTVVRFVRPSKDFEGAVVGEENLPL